MIRTIRLLLLPAALVALVLVAPSQASASVLDVQRDCADSDIFEKKHSTADLKAALGQIQADLGEYGTCGRMIKRELDKRRRASNGPTASQSSNVPVDLDGDGVISEQEREIAKANARERNGKDGKGSDERTAIAQVDGFSTSEDDDESSSGTVAASAGGGGGGSSLALILAVVALACGAVGGGLWYAGKRNPAIGNALRRVPVPFRNS